MKAEKQALPPVDVTNVETTESSIAFDVSRTGVPVMVKTSWYPNWEAEGAKGPWRATPNFMVVVPTSTHVELAYGPSKSDLLFNGLTLLGIVGAVVWRIRKPSFDRLGRAAEAGPT